MVINRKLEFVYLALPRTASRTVVCLLLQIDGSESHGMHHCMEVPEDCQTFLRFTVVRNPYARAYSEWCRYQNPTETPVHPGRRPVWKDVEFPSFCRGLADPMAKRMYPNMRDWIGSNRLDFWVQFEDIMPLLGDTRVGAKSPSRWESAYVPELRQLVADHAQDDFSLFNYDR